MASSILEGQQYALTSQFSKIKGQSMVFVKLTDSALKAIEDYAAALSKGNVSPSFKPSIEFRPNNSQGVISIPTKVNGGGGNGELAEKQSYNFSVKDVQNDGIQEAVQQNRREMSMDSLGKIMLRMQIHANDDSYQNTRVKMDQAKQDLQKYNTKVIQQGDPNVGRKVKVKRPAGGGGTFPGNSKSLPNKPNFPGGSSAEFSSSSASCANATSSSSSNLAPATTSSAASSSSLSSSTAAAASMYNKKSPSMPSSHLLTSMPRFGSKFTTNSAPTATGGGGSSSLNSNSSSSSNSLLAAAANNRQSTMSPPLPEATKRALRETIVHLLALRPMKLGELMGKAQEKVPGFSLTTPSSTSSTREQLLAVINAVASTKDSAVAGGTPLYHLKEGGWEELQLDWPHYSREDRELAMRRNPLMAANHVSPTTTSAQNNNGASNHHHSQHPPPPSTSSYNANHPHPKSSAVNGLSSSISPLSDGSSIRSMVHSTPSPTTSDICQPSPPPPPSHPPSLLTTSHSSSGSSSHHHQFQLQHNKAKDFSPPLSNGSSSSSGSSGSDRPRHNSSNQQQQALKRVGSGVGNYDGRYSSNSNNNNIINGLKKFKATNSSSSHYNNNNGSSISSKVGSDGMKSNGGTGSHNGHNGHNNLNSSSNPQQQQHPYSKYTRIQSAEQLAAYRADFYAEFPEYRKQFEYVDGVSREFERLREVVLSKDEDSEEWQDAVRQTIVKYEEVKNDSRFSWAQKRLQHLHNKLLHIKNLIIEYNQRHGGGALSAASGHGGGGTSGHEAMPRLLGGGGDRGDRRPAF